MGVHGVLHFTPFSNIYVVFKLVFILFPFVALSVPIDNPRLKVNVWRPHLCQVDKLPKNGD